MVSVHFRVNYVPPPGQYLAIVGDHASFGTWNGNRSKKMQWKGDGNWEVEVVFPEGISSFQYNYTLKSGENWSLYEAGPRRELSLAELKGQASLLVLDIWRSSWNPELSPEFNSSLFTDVIYGRDTSNVKEAAAFSSFKPDANSTLIRFEVHCIFIPKGATVKVSGAIPELGNWDAAKGVELSGKDYPFWSGTVQVPNNRIPFNYKYVIVGGEVSEPAWEEGADRVYWESGCSAVKKADGPFKRSGEWRGAGVAVPIFALRTKNGLGVGEFLDIKPLVDWSSECGLKIVQILPINDTTVKGDWRDSYPYSANSVFALHPMYINLDKLTKDPAILKDIAAKRNTLNALPKIDYEQVTEFKFTIMKKVFDQSKEFLNSPDFKKWLAQNEHWLLPYSLFMTFRKKFGTSDWSQWKDRKDIDRETVRKLSEPSSEFYQEVSFYNYIQYNLHLQLKEAADYAATKGVGIKGDIAIGVNPKSVDTWIEPHLFRLHKSTGAPPDFFSDEGQNWGFPTYNWIEMSKDDYGWWRARLSQMAQYFDAFRIDHILGFFRIWEMPANAVTGLLGRFYPSIPVSRQELANNGMWDIDRLVKPYIKSHLVERYVGQDLAEEVMKKCLKETQPYTWEFKPEYASEKAVAAAFPTTGKDAEKNGRIKSGLFKLLQNVIFLQDDEDPNSFYPRIEFAKTTSFYELDAGYKPALTQIYLDYFFRRQEGLWADTAMERLPIMVHSTKMLCCGEDLGMVPKCVDGVLKALRILSLRIQRMPDDPKKEFYHCGEYPHLSVCTPSVHDTSTLRGWWEEDLATTQRFWNQILGQQGEVPSYCDCHSTYKVIRQHLESKSMLAVFPIQDLFGLSPDYIAGRDPKEERINIPAIAEHYWRYRLHIPLEDLIQDKEYIQSTKNLIQQTGRLGF
eukprot:TRINITY_DN1920_c0_g1_i1.p1 TRINITY_DN1920_c0_g1~~TRINITY_DN1920_c0_g1_i1.p1  ORF type:complete len:907 (-),score=345.64 TRINITY_DN1920_c0_g1_i1:195-2915(-)